MDGVAWSTGVVLTLSFGSAAPPHLALHGGAVAATTMSSYPTPRIAPIYLQQTAAPLALPPRGVPDKHITGK